jgi:hypothetical protein
MGQAKAKASIKAVIKHLRAGDCAKAKNSLNTAWFNLSGQYESGRAKRSTMTNFRRVKRAFYNRCER